MQLLVIAGLLAVVISQMDLPSMTRPARPKGRDAMRPNVRLPAFLAWSAAGFLSVGTVLTILSIGVFVAPIALVTVYLVARRFRYNSAALGAITGVGGFFVIVGIIAALSTNPGPSPILWLTTGILLMLAGYIAFLALEIHRQHRASEPNPGAEAPAAQ